MAHDVFISYSHTDKAVADAVCATLEGAKIRCWVAPRDILPGKRWGSSIIDAISKSRVCILILTARSNTSDQVLNEIERAVGKGIPILPIRTEDVTPAEDLELFIMNRHWLDAISPPFEQHLERLTSTVEALLELRPPVDDKTVAEVPEVDELIQEPEKVQPVATVPPVTKDKEAVITVPPVAEKPKPPIKVEQEEPPKPQPNTLKKNLILGVSIAAGAMFLVFAIAMVVGLFFGDPEKFMVGSWDGKMYDSTGKLDTYNKGVKIDFKADKTWSASDQSSGTWAIHDKKVALTLINEEGKPADKTRNEGPAIFDIADDKKTATSDLTEGSYKGRGDKVVLTKMEQ